MVEEGAEGAEASVEDEEEVVVDSDPDPTPWAEVVEVVATAQDGRPSCLVVPTTDIIP